MNIQHAHLERKCIPSQNDLEGCLHHPAFRVLETLGTSLLAVDVDVDRQVMGSGKR